MSRIGNMLESKDRFNRRNTILDTCYFMKSLFIIYKNNFYAGIIQYKLKVIYIDGGINRYKQSANLLHGEIEHHPFRPVLAKDGYLIPALDSHIIGDHSQDK